MIEPQLIPLDWGALGNFVTAAMPLFIDTLVLTCRALAGTIGAILFMVWWQQRAGEEIPPYDRKRTDRAFLWFHAGCLNGAIAFTALDFTYRNVTGNYVGDLFVLASWWCWANAATERMAAKMYRPRYAYVAASIFMLALPLYVLVTDR